MKYISFLILFTISINLSSNAQVLLERKNIEEVRKLETEQHSENKGFKKIQVSSDFFHGAQEKVDYYPLTFKRVIDPFKPVCEIEYYYSSKDSVVNAVVYDWNIMNEVTNLKTDGYKFEQQVTRKEEYIQQYNMLRDQVIKLLGEPSKTEKINEEGHVVTGETDWNLADKDIRLTLAFSTQLKVMSPYKLGTFKIRLITDWK
jgi:hypothetical protein